MTDMPQGTQPDQLMLEIKRLEDQLGEAERRYKDGLLNAVEFEKQKGFLTGLMDSKSKELSHVETSNNSGSYA